MSAVLRIPDLAAPELSATQRAIHAAAEKQPVAFQMERVLDEAARATGLSDFGPDDFRERLAVWLESFDADATLSAVGRHGAFRECLRHASTRLRLVDYIKRHPDALREKIERPIIIVGLPRSGTTHLLNLIAADQRLRALPYWESLEPVPPPLDVAGPDGEDPRLARCREIYEAQRQALPLLRNMHDMNPEHIHEEIELMGSDFSTYTIEWIATVPRWRDYYFAHDQRPHYAWLKRALQVLQQQRGPRRWVLKSPQHLEQLGPLLDTFPDATLVFTHRDPVSVISSALTMVSYGERMRCKRANPAATAAYWIPRISRLLECCVRDRALAPAAQSLDVPFHELMQNDEAMLERIYALAELPLTEDARRQHTRYRKHNPRGKHGRIAYDLKRDFGIEPAALRERFQFYSERFPVRIEADAASDPDDPGVADDPVFDTAGGAN